MKKLIAIAAFTSAVLCAQAATRPILLNWTASTSVGVTGYNIYRSNTSGGPYTKINAIPITGLTFTDPAVTIGTSVFYVATAIGAACTVPPAGPCGLESPFSSPEAAVNPVPTRTGPPGPVIIIIP